MARFPVLEVEKAVQVGDKTRFDGTKSFVSKGATALTTLTIKPGADESAVSVFSTDSKQWFLDWKFTAFKLDVDSTNNKINFTANGAEQTATVASSTYTISTLPAAIKVALDAVGAGVFTVTIDKDEEMTIASTVPFALLPLGGSNRDTGLLPTLGFKVDMTSLKTSEEGEIIDGLTRKITITAGDGVGTDTEDKYIKVYSEIGDALFSNDSDLMSHKSDILKYVPSGRSSFKDTHRRAQELIIAWLDEQGYTNVFGEKFNKFDIVDKEEVRQWSTAMTLKLIHRNISNAIDDIFAEEAKEFYKQEIVHRNRAILRIDVDDDKKADLHEQFSISTGTLVRR
jgi:hypothetical protein